MAGIGFRLTRLIRADTVAGTMGAFGLAMLVGSGAWLLSVMSLALLTMLLPGGAPQFFVVLTTAFAVSLIAMGPMQMILSRDAADNLFVGDRRRVFPSMLGAMVFTGPPAAVIGAFIFSQAGLGAFFKLEAVSVFVVICWIWIASAYVSGAKDHMKVIFRYIAGYGLTIGAAWGLGVKFGDAGALSGFLTGNLLLLFLLIDLVADGYGASPHLDFGFLRAFPKYRSLAICGLLYNIGLWADKLIVWWFSPFGMPVSGALHGAPTYDFAVNISLLSIIPGMATFLLTIESDFAAKHNELLLRINYGGGIRAIREAKEDMARSLREGLLALCRVQGSVTVVSIVATQMFGLKMGLDPVRIATLTVMLVAMSGLPLTLSLLTVLFYLDRRREALVTTGVFAGLNVIGTAVLVNVTTIPNAYGFALAVYGAIFIATLYANRAVNRIDHLIFAGQRASE